MKIVRKFLKWLRGDKQGLPVTKSPQSESEPLLASKSFAEQLADCWNPSTSSYLRDSWFMYGRKSWSEAANRLANGEKVGVLRREPSLINPIFDSMVNAPYSYSNVECETDPELPTDAQRNLIELEAASVIAKSAQAIATIVKAAPVKKPKKKSKSKKKNKVKSKVKTKHAAKAVSRGVRR